MQAGREIVVLGLGPGRWEDLTLEAERALTSSSHIVFRTLRHPTVDALRERRPEVAISSFDDLYERAGSFAALYPEMVERLLALAGEAPSLVYAVPGHPLIAEASVKLLRQRAGEQGVGVRIVAGLSFLEPVCAALGIDPLERDMQLLDATQLADVAASALMGALQPTHPALIAQMYNRRLASGVKLALSEVYPDDWEVAVVRWASMPGQETVSRLPLYALDRDEEADHLTTLYVPPLEPLRALRVPEGLRYVTARLRAPDGCPWDRQQTHQSLRKYVLEEAYEVAEALDEWDGGPEQAEKLAEELGDLLLQVYLQAEIADQEDLFHIGDVYQAITEKLIRRHPHVFGDVAVRDAEHVTRNWETIKRAEREAKGEDIAAESRLRGVPKSAPALYQARELTHKAAKAGFAWPDRSGTFAKVREEVEELRVATESGDSAATGEELGDLLLIVARLADELGVQPEDALHRANQKFRRRFEAMEARARREDRSLESLSFAEWEDYWQEAKGS